MRKTSIVILAAALWLLLQPYIGFSCGPGFPRRVLVSGDEGLLAAPDAVFSDELDKLIALVPGSLPKKTRDDISARQLTDETDIKEFSETVASLRLGDVQSKRLIEDYTEKRKILSTFYRLKEDEEKALFSWAEQNFEDGPPMLRQYYGYLLGAMHYHMGGGDSAKLAWRMVMLLPEELRRQRSVWVCYMLGECFGLFSRIDSVSEETSWQWFDKAQELVAEGLPDSLNLMRNIYGWKARKYWWDGDEVQAVTMYLQLADKESLCDLCSSIVNRMEGMKEGTLEPLVGDLLTRRMITLYLIAKSNRFPQECALWLGELSTRDDILPQEAAEIGWLAYAVADYSSAEKWLLNADDSVLAKRLQVKLFLRRGRIDEAIDGLAALICECSVEQRRQIADILPQDGEVPSAKSVGEILLGELGTLYLSRGLFVEALDKLYTAGYWGDAAYVAERVLTADELISYVDAIPASQAGKLHYLLARRLIREGRLSEAKAYCPTSLHALLDRYQQDLTIGGNISVPSLKRGLVLADAARIMKEYGMALTATEVEPDWHLYDCDYLTSSPAERAGLETGAISGMSREEETRLKKSDVEYPQKRFHYRYTAIGLAREAALFLPDNSDALAQILCDAGSWIKADDPEGADYFYKTLVRRAGNTALGKAAEEKHWFPDCSEAAE
jgi:hypothetical protein